jgi:diguanylate cyclase (GGDEF)-like protein/PAS domain S-box-containing protein
MMEISSSINSLQLIISNLPIGVLLVEPEGGILFSNLKINTLFGYKENELLNHNVQDLLPSRLQKKHIKMMTKFWLEPSSRSMSLGRILLGKRKDGKEISIQLGLNPLVIEERECVAIFMIEVTNPILNLASNYDPLTGLPNRALFNEVSNNLRNLAIRKKAHLGMMFIDLDGFKNTNDQFGHHIGDLILCKVANILSKNIRKNDIISRIGGDEFVICLYEVENKAKLEYFSKKVIEQICSIQNINEHTIEVSASVGAIYVAIPDKISITDMIKMADKLMYKAKRRKKGTVCTDDCFVSTPVYLEH